MNVKGMLVAGVAVLGLLLTGCGSSSGPSAACRPVEIAEAVRICIVSRR